MFLDEGRGYARLVKQDTSPDTEGVGGIFLEVVNQASRRSVAILLPVINNNGAFLVL